MTDKVYSPEEIKQMREFELTMWLRDIKPGQVLTDKQYQAIRHYLGALIDAAEAIPMRKVSIHFDKVGQAHSIDNDGMIDSVNGKKL